jgi:DNA-binding GntR family transcriptional regulator
MPKARVRSHAQLSRYRRLADLLIAEIRGRHLRVGETLPGELDLVARHQVSRHTVREALRLLEQLGLIVRRRGVGTVVTARESRESYSQSVRSPAELMRYPPDSRLALLAREEVTSGRKLARLLGCPTGTRWCRLRAVRRMRSAKLPLCWVDVYLVPEYASVADSIGRGRKPVYQMIESRFGEKVQSVQIEIRAGLISPEISSALEVAAGSPSLTVIRRYLGQGRRLFEVSVSEHPADRYSYGLELRRGWQSGDGWSTG